MTVGLVFDPAYGSRLEALVRSMPVWVVDSPINRSVVEKLWQQRDDEGSETDVTTFEVKVDMSPDDLCLSILETIDLHHGEYSADPPYDALEVIGAHTTINIRNVLEKIGFEKVIETPEGFRASH